MKTVLILVMASPLVKPYDVLLEKQKQTWDSIDVFGVNTIYYYSDPKINTPTFIENDLILPFEEIVENNTIKYKKALEQIVNLKWDYVFRTNASSYIDKKRLLNFAQHLPIDKCYCGIDGGNFASGCGYFISRDLVECLIKNISDLEINIYEDCLTSAILQRYCNASVTPGALRVDYNHHMKVEALKKITFTDSYPYHYRCKSDVISDRNKDIEAFETLFNFLKDKP